MLLPVILLILGLIVLVWSADLFIDGTSNLARVMGMPPLLIGIIIIGFGTSAPELVVSAVSSLNGTPTVALGNAYGSDITNIALILGVVAIIKPITVDTHILKRELPILFLVTLFSAYLIADNTLSSLNAWLLLAVFSSYMLWVILSSYRHKKGEFTQNTTIHKMSTSKALCFMFVGLIALMGSSEALVWSAVEIAKFFGVSDLIIGLTIVAVGTSIPELAASIIAARKGETDLALGNIIGSNIFNTLAVVGISGVITPTAISPEIFQRDMFTILLLTASLFIFGYRWNKAQGTISRLDGIILVLAYLGYNAVLLRQFL